MTGREDRTDRYARGELSAREARELAQESLDDSELLEDLTYAALAQAGLSERSVAGKLVRFPRRAFVAAAGLAAAAALVLVSVYPRQPPVHLKPALISEAQPGQPVLLASGLQPAADGGAGQEVFRGVEPDSRSPRPAGSIISIDDGLAAIDLGSLDGLAKGSELGIFRDAQSTEAIGRLVVTTVFRDRARCRIVDGGKAEAHSQVRVAAADHLGALLEQVDALSNQGDSKGARAMAEKAVEWARSAHVPPDGKGKAFARLAALEYQAGSLQAAERDYQSAVDAMAEPQACNNLAVLHILRSDYDGAEGPLRQAVSLSPKTGVAYARSVNNLGALAELRGDRRTAAELYRDALRGFPADASAQERQAVEANLSRTRGAR